MVDLSIVMFKLPEGIPDSYYDSRRMAGYNGHSAHEQCDDCQKSPFSMSGYPVVSYVQTTHLAIMQVSSISNSPSHSMPLEDGPKTTRTGENCRNSSKH